MLCIKRLEISFWDGICEKNLMQKIISVKMVFACFWSGFGDAFGSQKGARYIWICMRFLGNLERILDGFFVFAWGDRPKTVASEDIFSVGRVLEVSRSVPSLNFWWILVGRRPCFEFTFDARSCLLGGCSKNWQVHPQYGFQEILCGSMRLFLNRFWCLRERSMNMIQLRHGTFFHML